MAAFPKSVELGVRMPAVLAVDSVGLLITRLCVGCEECAIEYLTKEAQFAWCHIGCFFQGK